MIAIRIAILGLLLVFFSCKEKDKHGNVLDTPTGGTIKIAVDESLRPLVEAELMAFEGIYDQAHVVPVYTSEEEAIRLLIRDSVRLAFVTRKLTTEELIPFEREKITPPQVGIATGAVAIILNKSNPDSLIRVSQLRDILAGKIAKWKQLNPSSSDDLIEVIFDNPLSGIARFLKDSLANGNPLPSNAFAVRSNEAVIDYISGKPNAIGFIGSEWISDSNDFTANRFLNTIRVASLAGDSTYFLPYQAYIALHHYPLCRNTFVISREARSGLGSGFIAFVTSDKGQRIVLKAGLVPATMPVRIVEINSDNQ